VLVTVKGFGGIWERRFGTSAGSSKRFAQAAFYNTTGVQVSGKVHYRWRIGGKIRFRLCPSVKTRINKRRCC